MNPLENKVQSLLSKVLGSGEVYLFALFEREDGKWDILVSSDWSDKDPQGVVRALSKDLVAMLSKEEILVVSRIVVIPSAAPAVTALARAMSMDSGSAHLEDSNLFGLQIKRAVVFSSKTPKQPSKAPEPTPSSVC